MTIRQSSGILAAAGYPQFNDARAMTMYVQKYVERFWCTSIVPEITTSQYLNELGRCGDTISFPVEPCVSVTNGYVKDGTIKHSVPERRRVSLSVDKAVQFSWKFDMVDMERDCDFAALIASTLAATSKATARSIDCCVLNEAYACAHKSNRGNAAGVCSHCYNLGTVGAPLVINKDNIIDFLNTASAVLAEQCVDVNDLWMVVPQKFKYLLQQSELRSMCCGTGAIQENLILNGMLPNKLFGFRIYCSNSLDTTIDPVTGQQCFNIMFGHNTALSFATQLEKYREIDTDPNHWAKLYQGLMIYGFGVLQPETLGHAYITLG